MSLTFFLRITLIHLRVFTFVRIRPLIPLDFYSSAAGFKVSCTSEALDWSLGGELERAFGDDDDSCELLLSVK